MATPAFLNSDGTMTKDGAILTEWIEAQFSGIDAANDVQALNRLSGPIADYYVNVYKLHSMTPERWLKEHGNSFAPSAHGIMTWLEAQMATEQRNAETATKADKVADELESLKAKLAEAIAEIEALKESAQAEAAPVVVEPEPEAKPRKSRKAKVATVAATEADEPGAEADSDEPEGEDADSEA